MESSGSAGGREPLCDLSNSISTPEGEKTLIPLRTQIVDTKELKRLRDRERFTSMSDEKRYERNKKRRESYHTNNQENEDQNAGVQSQLTEVGNVPMPLQTKGDCPKERRRQRDRERRAAMTPEQAALVNKKKRDWRAAKNATKKSNNELPLSESAANSGTDEDDQWLHRGSPNTDVGVQQLSGTSCPLSTGQDGPCDRDHISLDGTPETDGNTSPTQLDPKERRRLRDRARRAPMSPEQRALVNKRRREQNAARNAAKNVARKLPMSPKTKKAKNNECKKLNKRAVREHRANNLHPKSMAMPNPHFSPDPTVNFSSQNPLPISSYDEIMLEPKGTPFIPYSTQPDVQSANVDIPELMHSRVIHSHSVTPGERNSLRT